MSRINSQLRDTTRKTFPAGLAILSLFSILSAGFLGGCEESSTAAYDVPTWNCSGVVLDGSVDSALAGATIEYVDADGVARMATTGRDGGFLIGGLPFGQSIFRFSCRKRVGSDSTILFGERILAASSYNESSSMSGALAGGARLVRLFPLTGAFSGELVVEVAGSSSTLPARAVPLRLVYRDTSFVNGNPASFVATTDSNGRFRFSGLPADSGLQLSIQRFEQGGRAYRSSLVPVPMLRAGAVVSLGRIVSEADTAADYVEPIASSNVLDAAGLGLSGISRSEVPWFRISHRFDPVHLGVQLLDGATAIPVVPLVRGDTVFLQHASPFPADVLLTVEITGLDGSGRRFRVLLDGNRRFRTAKPLVALESNAWNTSASYRSSTALGDTLWVRFGAKLSSNPDHVEWIASDAERTLYGRGPDVNSRAWTKADTLFVVPDSRLNIDTVGSLGFKVVVRSASGAQSETTEITSRIRLDAYAIRSSSVINALGAFRDDVGSTDSVVIVASRRIASVLRVVPVSGSALPTGIQPGDVSLRGNDTIVFRPSAVLVPGTVYGMAFDLRSPEGVVYRSVLPVRWKTEYRTSILSVNNRDGLEYRRFRSTGDNFVVRFSQAIDTSKPFTVRMKDAKGNPIQTRVSWNAALDQATIANITPLPLANYGIASTTGAGADSARAVSDVSFDLQSRTGERILGLRVTYDSLRIYTEAGLCAVSSNILKAHSPGFEIASTEAVVDSFPLTGTIRVGFDRALDTAWIRRNGDSTFVSLQTSSGPVVPSDIRFEDGGRTLVVDPRASLVAGTSYFLQLVRIPGKDIRDAVAIGRHGGKYSGTTSTGFLVGTPFTAR